MQLTHPRCSPKAEAILQVLTSADGAWVSGAAFLSGRLGVRCSSYSQRCGDLRRVGYNIEHDRRGPDGLARYRLVRDE